MTGPDFDPPIDRGDLPASYGRNRVVLLPVDPYLIHIYWDLFSLEPPPKSARPILRFHESQPDSDTQESRPFDVDVNLAASSWYVNLWSPDKLYYADLGWRGDDGSFLVLARSNTVRTPPAWPHAPEPVDARVDVEEVAHNVPVEEATAEASVEVMPASVETHEPDSSEHLNRKLADLFAIRGDVPPAHEPEPIFHAAHDIPGEPEQLDTPNPPPWTGLQETDLTQLSEERFTSGISSQRDPLSTLEGPFGN